MIDMQLKSALMVVLALLSPLQGYAQDLPVCRELLSNESDLDTAFDLSSLVFIARISPRGGVNDKIYNYTRFDPVLKGSVPAEGFITYADNCEPMDDDSIYVFFLDSMQERISGFNSRFFSLPDGGPGYSWVADWIETKIP